MASEEERAPPPLQALSRRPLLMRRRPPLSTALFRCRPAPPRPPATMDPGATLAPAPALKLRGVAPQPRTEVQARLTPLRPLQRLGRRTGGVGVPWGALGCRVGPGRASTGGWQQVAAARAGGGRRAAGDRLQPGARG